MRIIRRIMQWNLHSNASDVLGLGPRTAGQLATVGIRTVAELLAAKPAEVATRLQQESLNLDVLTAWQCEARLIIALPQLPAAAARLLSTAGFSTGERIGRCTPTEILALLETAQQKYSANWLAKTTLPTIAEVSGWIQLAQQSEKNRAA